MSLTLPAFIQSNSTDETEAIGKSLAERLISDQTLPRFVALYGDLGVGKTAFIRGFTSRIAPNARVKSPTFSLVHEYRGEALSVFHFDLYRIEDEDELYSIGFYDYLDRRGICLTEWSEKIEYALPDRYLRVEIVKNSAEYVDSRELRITPVGFTFTENL
ncbi:MAG: tRNA (adenosine(37)-N6)-threonylcarbamoyltransferase complex ATPase subunit type 1 TsaE [Clostridia bacterium]|nr:tRNA (adenosine(37)-N6)-threonylcarbamoyltransferase complex ATPase subunit type 1 TsaE [Clostridia bacterium]